MISKKICMLGSFSVGKTSLIKQFVSSIFDEQYHTTIGVKADNILWSVAQSVPTQKWRPGQNSVFHTDIFQVVDCSARCCNQYQENSRNYTEIAMRLA